MIRYNYLKSKTYKINKNKKVKIRFAAFLGGNRKTVVLIWDPHNLKTKVFKMIKNYISPNLLYKLKAKIKTYGETIARTKFCEVCGFLNCNTLRNKDSMLEGVITRDDHSQYVCVNKKVYYTIEAACSYLDRLFNCEE
ncbi:MAG: hypothetical protein E7021_01610 [Alphaproteobacteria bacterium]|nr:hypothetical protein [Alphaproteobacteria bacterium]